MKSLLRRSTVGAALAATTLVIGAGSAFALGDNGNSNTGDDYTGNRMSVSVSDTTITVKAYTDNGSDHWDYCDFNLTKADHSAYAYGPFRANNLGSPVDADGDPSGDNHLVQYVFTNVAPGDYYAQTRCFDWQYGDQQYGSALAPGYFPGTAELPVSVNSKCLGTVFKTGGLNCVPPKSVFTK